MRRAKMKKMKNMKGFVTPGACTERMSSRSGVAMRVIERQSPHFFFFFFFFLWWLDIDKVYLPLKMFEFATPLSLQRTKRRPRGA
jgi:hypothetical protein